MVEFSTSDDRGRREASCSPPVPAAEVARRLGRAMAAVKPGARVVAAMSGGVDSSVVAALLKHAGYDVIGVTMQLYDNGAATGRSGSCCAGQDIHDARQVAAALDIPHYVLDYERRFRDRVIDPFIASYRGGDTPVPCVGCNSDLKFGELLQMATSLGADAMATGHYVQRVPAESRLTLRRARDESRDQSYFLFSTTAAQLNQLVFPLGAFLKSEIRALAVELGVPVATKADSQDICFVPRGSYAETIERLHPGAGEAGEIVHIDGRVLGNHAGIINYTVGQRKGLGVAAGEPLFVVSLDARQRRVVVGPRSALGINHIELRGVNWLGDGSLAAAVSGAGTPLWVRLRSSQPLRRALLTATTGTIKVLLTENELGIATGQACAFYDSDMAEGRVLGGGWIAKTHLDLATSGIALPIVAPV